MAARRRSAFACSVMLHLLAASVAILYPLWQGHRIDVSQAFVVNLVSEPGPPAAAPAGGALLAPPPSVKADVKAAVKALVQPAPDDKVVTEKPLAVKKINEKVPPPAPARPAVQPERQIADAVGRLRREVALNSTIAQMRHKLTGSETGEVFSGGAAGAQLPPSLSRYYDELWKRVQGHWALPATRRGLQTIVAVRIIRDGTVEKAEIETGSGDARFDRSALDAVRAANPLPPLPGDYRGSWHEVGIRFRQ
jgi:TolA protein